MLLIVILLGLVIGSFLNVVILRHEAGKAVTGRSGCLHCGHTLRWYELVPVVSYLLQRGRCRVCKVHITLQYPLVEALTAIVFVAVYYHLGSFDVLSTSYKLQATSFSTFYVLLSTFFHFTMWSILIVITVYDLRTKIIPDRFNSIFAVLALCTTLLDTFSSTSYQAIKLSSYETLASHLLAGMLLFLPFYALWKFSDGRWIGLGDGKLAVGIGFLLGIMGGFSAVMFGFWVGAVIMLAVIATQRIVMYVSFRRRHYNLQPTTYNLKSEIPFGPFLVIGTAIVYLTGTTFLTLFW